MTAADRPSVTDDARAEAEKAIEAIIDHSGDLPPGAPSRGARAGNVVGTLIELGWAAGRAEPTTATTEDADDRLRVTDIAREHGKP